MLDKLTQDRIQAAFRAHLDEMLCSEATCTATNASDKPLTLAGLEEAYRKIRPLQPVARAIWAVDCPDEWARMRQRLEQMIGYQQSPNDYLGYSLMGMPIYVWSSEGKTLEERKCVPWHGWAPGVWIEMSDGNHVRVKDEPEAPA